MRCSLQITTALRFGLRKHPELLFGREILLLGDAQHPSEAPYVVLLRKRDIPVGGIDGMQAVSLVFLDIAGAVHNEHPDLSGMEPVCLLDIDQLPVLERREHGIAVDPDDLPCAPGHPADAHKHGFAGSAVQHRAGTGRGCLITTIISVVILAILAVFGSQLPSDGGGQDTLALVQTGAHSYRVAESGEAADLTLGWDRDSESYYDPGSECWVWYNTDVSPNVWQYWVEGISSDYGDYGWMEHDETGWYIEADQGVWTEVPAWYDTSGLWYFD